MKCYFHTPPFAVLGDHFGRRRFHLGAQEHLVPPLPFLCLLWVVDQRHRHRLLLAGVIPQDPTYRLHPQHLFHLRQRELLFPRCPSLRVERTHQGKLFAVLAGQLLEGLGFLQQLHRRRQTQPFLPRSPPLPLHLRHCRRVQGRLLGQRADHHHVVRQVCQHGGVDVGFVGDQAEGSARDRQGEVTDQLGSQFGAFVVPRFALLAEDAPEHRQGEVAVRTEGQLHDQGHDHIVEAEAENLARPGGQDRIEEDTAEGDLLATFVTESVIDDNRDQTERDEVGEDEQAQERAEFVPIPLGTGEEGVDGVEVHLRPQASELPDLGEGAATQTEDPGDDNRLEDGKGLRASETATKLPEQFDHGNAKMLHGWTPSRGYVDFGQSQHSSSAQGRSPPPFFYSLWALYLRNTSLTLPARLAGRGTTARRRASAQWSNRKGTALPVRLSDHA